MGPQDPPKGPPKLGTAARPPVPASAPASAKAPKQAARDAVTHVVGDTLAAVSRVREQEPSYLKLAFANPYNLSLLTGALAVAAITAGPLIAVGALAAEGLWLLFGPEMKILQERLWAPEVARKRREAEAKARRALIEALNAGERERVEALVARQEQIRRLAAQNPSFTGDLLRGELSKTDRLVDAFVEMALTCARYVQYLASVDGLELERDRDRYTDAVNCGTPGETQTQIAQKNLDIVKKRIERMEEIRRYLNVARGQLDLIENSFELIADQIVTMQSPKELSGQLDELLDGVEAIRETARDTDRILGTIDREL